MGISRCFVEQNSRGIWTPWKRLCRNLLGIQFMFTGDPIFAPLEFPNSSLMKVKNRIFRSSISGRFDNYDGSGTHARINWEEKFARGGVGAIISSFVPVHLRGRILPN